MIREHYEAVCRGTEVRKNLIAMNRDIRNEEERSNFAVLINGDYSKLTGLLENGDPKVRKNAALLLGAVGANEALPSLYRAYEKEKTLYVRADYLKAMGSLNAKTYVKAFMARLEKIRKYVPSEEERKHLREEELALESLIDQFEPAKLHQFVGMNPAPDLILVTNRCQREATAKQITTGRIQLLKTGVKVSEGNFDELLRIRTIAEYLLPIPRLTSVGGTPEEIGGLLAGSCLVDLLEDIHKPAGSFRYRIALKTTLPLEKRGPLIRKISQALDEGSDRRMRNSSSDYEVEIRLIEKKDGSYVPLLKLFTLPDTRFSYRKEVIASSIAPVNAALTVEIARPFMKEGAQILDPFCGVGTMLIERVKAVKADPIYAVDIYGEAVERGKINAEAAGTIIHFIHRDFFTFTHDYLFDEIITDMPRKDGNMEEEELETLYNCFFEKARTHLKEEGLMVLYCDRPQYVQAALTKNPGWQKCTQALINEKNQTNVFVIRV